MKGDFSRLTGDRSKHYTAVLMQQGRLQIDADWNEQVDIVLHRLETQVADLIGHTGVPSRGGDGFAVTVRRTDEHAPWALLLSPGRCYVEGKLFENDTEQVQAIDTITGAGTDPGRYVVYLDGWQRHVTAVEDPTIREVALGGADTATRVEHAWRLELHPMGDAVATDLRRSWAPPRPAISSGLLNARVNAHTPFLENQLYRVEIVGQAGDGTVSFTWSRDNGAVVAAVANVFAASRTITVAGTGRDSQTSIRDGDWVELVPLGATDDGRGPVVQVDRVDGDALVITETTWPWSQTDAPALGLVRRWDDARGVATAPVVASDAADGWVGLEAGIEVRFQAAPDGGREYRPGDYWVLPSRTATAAVEWPSTGGVPVAQPPRGVHHWFAPLALLQRSDGDTWSLAPDGDLRPVFSPLQDGFVSKGPAGDAMRGPLRVEPLLTATQDGQTLVATTIQATFDDAGHSTRHTALRVTEGDVEFGTMGQPDAGIADQRSTLTVNGDVVALGLVYGRTLDVGTELTVGVSGDARVHIGGQVSVQAHVGGGPVDWRLQIGDPMVGIGFADGSAPTAGFLRFGDNTGWKLQIGRAREAAGAAANGPGSGVLVTVQDNGAVGVGTDTPLTPLHVRNVRPGGLGYLSVTTPFVSHTVGTLLRDPNTPPGTVLLGGCHENRIYFWWKDEGGTVHGAGIGATDDDTFLLAPYSHS